MKEDFDNENELKKMSPHLWKLKSLESGLKVPEGYFDSLAGEIQHKIQSLPDFEKTSQENYFKVPEGYFSSLPTVIQQRIIDEKQKNISWQKSIGSVFFRPKFTLAFASLAIVAIFSVKYFTRSIEINNVASNISYSELSSSDYLSEIDESILAETLASEGTSTLEQKNISIEDYLIENNIDLTQLTAQL